MTTCVFEGSLRAITEEWCLNFLGLDAGNVPDDMPATGVLVLVAMASEQFALGDDIARHVLSRLDLEKVWDADVVTLHGLSKLKRAGYLSLDERGLEEVQAARAANKFDHCGACWTLTELGAEYAFSFTYGAGGVSTEALIERNKAAIARVRVNAN